jgi:hypothetical protein
MQESSLSNNYEKALKAMVIQERREELSLLFDFANADLEKEKNKILCMRLWKHLSRHQALHPDNRNLRAEDNAIIKILGEMQKHLHSRFENIVKNSTTFGEDLSLWAISGTTNFTVDRITDRFREVFQLQKVKIGNEPNAYKKVLDLCLMEIIRDLDANPRRFGQCPHCSSFFCNLTDKKKIYCSLKCANTARQQKCRKERRGEDE